MSTYVVLTRISPESMSSPTKLKKLEDAVKQKVSKHCPKVKWLASYAVLGPYDYLDLIEAPDDVAVSKVATIIRSFGHATTETWGAVPWDRFKQTLEELGS